MAALQARYKPAELTVLTIYLDKQWPELDRQIDRIAKNK